MCVCVWGERYEKGKMDSQMMKMAAFQPPLWFEGWWMRELVLLLLLLVLPSAMVGEGKKKVLRKFWRGFGEWCWGVRVGEVPWGDWCLYRVNCERLVGVSEQHHSKKLRFRVLIYCFSLQHHFILKRNYIFTTFWSLSQF